MLINSNVISIYIKYTLKKLYTLHILKFILLPNSNPKVTSNMLRFIWDYATNTKLLKATTDTYASNVKVDFMKCGSKINI
jgi:hypothetical protein